VWDRVRRAVGLDDPVTIGQPAHAERPLRTPIERNAGAVGAAAELQSDEADTVSLNARGANLVAGDPRSASPFD